MKDPVVTRAVGGLTVVAALCVFGCAQERDPINRVQANALAKSFFVGADLQSPADDPEFYMRGTVVDVGYGAGADGLFTSTYAQPVSRIRWEITEDVLIARLTYERIDEHRRQGQPVNGVGQMKSQTTGRSSPATRSRSHFDIKRDYNPHDRRRAERRRREHDRSPLVPARVHARRLVAEPDHRRLRLRHAVASSALIGGVEVRAARLLRERPERSRRAALRRGRRLLRRHQQGVRDAGDDRPLRASAGASTSSRRACSRRRLRRRHRTRAGNCNPVEITLRQSFRKVVDTDYEPVDLDGFRFQAFGAFNSAAPSATPATTA